ncbi:hypothetical protein GTP45_00880 [Pseudoduganella sp. FT55W]|uniref:Type II toxin-antitoxin system RelE/ParE family toxin n=1 Tax=Duganella rivi TaxID=2666083 RepID=A0A7X4GLU7_9BURK|nr:hypothetical protein [Duganella rivi]MYM65386.1 hypothetical protein [Duganella rivi]
MHTSGPHITTLKRLPRFERDYKSLSSKLQQAVAAAVADLMKHPIPNSRRLHSLRGHRNPKIFTIDVMSNHAYKISFEIDGETAILRRVATHKHIDDAP